MRLRATRGSVMSPGGIALPLSLDAQASAFFAARATPKLWVDAGLSAARYQDTGFTQALASGNSLGLILDRASGLARGVDGVTNGRFDTDSGWTKGSGWSISGGRANLDGTNTGSTLLSSVGGITTPIVVGKFYQVSFDYQAIGGRLRLNPVLGVSTTLLAAGSQGTYSVVVQAASTDPGIAMQAPDANTSGWIDNLSVMEIVGNHVAQSVASKKPTLLQANGLSWISADGVDDGMATRLPFDLSSVDRITLIAGYRKRNSDGTAMLAELGPEFVSGGALGLYSTSASPQAYFQWGVSGASGNPTPIMASTSPTDTCVIAATAWLGATSGPSMRIERISVVSGSTVTTVTDDNSIPGARNFKSDVLNLLCRNNASLFSPFDMSSFMLIGGPALTAAELLLLKRVTAEKTGIPL